MPGNKQPETLKNLADSVLAGDHGAIARVISLVENDTPTGNILLDALFSSTGHAHIIGITGSPGTGKSTLVNRLAYQYRHPDQDDQKRSVGIIAVDPTSSFTGGAVLGDRVRMRDLAGDAGIFIRSMASRGSLGGLAWKTYAVAQVMDAAGFDIIVIETVGAGQSEVDIARLAQTVVVVEAPSLGDDIQVIKAGLLEIADIIVLNKADLDGTNLAEKYLHIMLEMAAGLTKGRREYKISRDREEKFNDTWEIPLRKTIALTGEGTEELVEVINNHLDFLKQNNRWQLRQRLIMESQLMLLIKNKLFDLWFERNGKETINAAIDQVIERKISPQKAVAGLIKKQ